MTDANQPSGLVHFFDLRRISSVPVDAPEIPHLDRAKVLLVGQLADQIDLNHDFVEARFLPWVLDCLELPPELARSDGSRWR